MLLIAVIVGLYGLIIGSFLNAFVWRVHEGKSIAKGRSMCPKCEHELAAKDLVPLFSWLWLRGRCRYCKKPISPQYPLVELSTSLLFGASYAIILPVGAIGWVDFLVWLYLLASLIFLAVYDIKWFLLPNKVLGPAIAVAAGWLIIRFLAFGLPLDAFVRPSLAAAVGGLVFLILALLANGKLMGMGDVKLVFLMGIMLGIRKAVLAVTLSFYAAAVVGLVLILLHRKSRKDYLPFGPFLVGGTIIAYLWGAPIIEAYLRLNGLI